MDQFSEKLGRKSDPLGVRNSPMAEKKAQTKRNNPAESQENRFTIDSEEESGVEMPGVSRLLDRKKMETGSLSRSAMTALEPKPGMPPQLAKIPTSTAPDPGPGAYAPPPPGGELDLGLSLEDNATMEGLLDLRPDQMKTEVKSTTPTGMGQVELNAAEISDPGLSLDLGSLPETHPDVDAIQNLSTEADLPALDPMPSVTDSHSHLPFDMPSQSEIHALTQSKVQADRPATPAAGTLNHALLHLGDRTDPKKSQSILSEAPPIDPTVAMASPSLQELKAAAPPQAPEIATAPPPQTEIKKVKRRRGYDQGLIAQFTEDTIFAQMSKQSPLSQLLSFLTSVGMGSALVLQDGGGEVVATLALDAGHRSPLWRALKWNPSTGGDAWTLVSKQQFCEVAPASKLPEGAPQPSATLVKNGLRAAFGVESDEFLTLLQIEFPEFGRGVLAIITASTIQAAMAQIRPLLKVSGPPPGLMAA